ncbi:tyrosine-type recombinase/integrase [Evansella cellulosilytica]|uniref:Integrase family protein n=1 Tax=Evansella cellulosilytica (strain ATCC 21833 / DSM 2522 / FERM P-1141 / JCM 9156 / N-4) TaxID=649639 RepID=E6TR18_EVAC2|nr:tyrosine-type recombinase/integrase [Evansella cellulosilytica]ADU29394.1 integrase family protein [Evansella cellulosilytica DSM 2522]
MNLVEPIKSEKDIEKLKAVLKSQNYRDYLLFVLGINTGMKICDILFLKFQDVFHQGEIVSSIHISGDNYPINSGVKECLLLFVEQQKREEEFLLSRYIFESRKGREPIDRSHAYRILNDASIKIGLKANVGTNTMRKTFGYHHYKKFKDINYLQKLFHHSSSKKTLKYIGFNSAPDNKDSINEFIL